MELQLWWSCQHFPLSSLLKECRLKRRPTEGTLGPQTASLLSLNHCTVFSLASIKIIFTSSCALQLEISLSSQHQLQPSEHRCLTQGVPVEKFSFSCPTVQKNQCESAWSLVSLETSFSCEYIRLILEPAELDLKNLQVPDPVGALPAASKLFLEPLSLSVTSGSISCSMRSSRILRQDMNCSDVKNDAPRPQWMYSLNIQTLYLCISWRLSTPRYFADTARTPLLKSSLSFRGFSLY